MYSIPYYGFLLEEKGAQDRPTKTLWFQSLHSPLEDEEKRRDEGKGTILRNYEQIQDYKQNFKVSFEGEGKCSVLGDVDLVLVAVLDARHGRLLVLLFALL